MNNQEITELEMTMLADDHDRQMIELREQLLLADQEYSAWLERLDAEWRETLRGVYDKDDNEKTK